MTRDKRGRTRKVRRAIIDKLILSASDVARLQAKPAAPAPPAVPLPAAPPPPAPPITAPPQTAPSPPPPTDRLLDL